MRNLGWAALALTISGVGSSSAQAQLPLPTPSPLPALTAPAEGMLSSVPLFARLAADGTSLHTYSVPIHIMARVRKSVLSVGFARDGNVSFEEPDHLSISIQSVPERYANVFAQLGTPRTWPWFYDLELRDRSSVAGRDTYELTGVPRGSSDVDHVVIRMSDESQPIEAQWVLHDGWTITSTIVLESIGNYLVSKTEEYDITGHGFKIHSEIQYGNYKLNGETAAPS